MTSFVSRFAKGAFDILTEGHKDYVRKQELVEIRKKRKKQLEKWREVGIGPPVYQDRQIEVLVDMALQEASLRPDFNPDLLVVTEPQYKCMFDIPAGVPIDPDDWHHYFETAGTESDRQRVLPPSRYSVDAGEIDVLYSSSADGMLLVESESLE